MKNRSVSDPHPAVLVCELRGYVRPLPRGRLPHEVDVHPLSGQRAHVQRAVREAGRERLGAALADDDVVGAVVGRAVAVVRKREKMIFYFTWFDCF